MRRSAANSSSGSGAAGPHSLSIWYHSSRGPSSCSYRPSPGPQWHLLGDSVQDDCGSPKSPTERPVPLEGSRAVAGLDNLVLINKIKEQLMAEKIRPLHLPPTSSPSQQQALLMPSSPSDGGGGVGGGGGGGGGVQHGMQVPKLQSQQVLSGHHPSSQSLPQGGSGQPDIALHARPPSSSGPGSDLPLMTATGLAPSSRPENHGASEALTPTTPTSSGQNRLCGAQAVNILSGLASGPGMEHMKTGGLAGLLGPPPKAPRGRKKIKAENTGPLLVAKPHKCPHCSKSFANASYLAQHLRIHLGIKPYHCSYCENSFRQLSHLQQHTRIHTGDRPYKCAHPGCEKAFTQLSNLQSHQRQHNKDKPYKCPNCYRAYSDSASLQIHMSAHAIKNAKAYCCSMCGRAYTSETYLMRHMSKHTVVEHMVSHQSPQRTESPGIPSRISLI
ncbi:hypothetical protein CRUP_009558 [Coryphaenoides rupestris]|nr:hypothetical protein CRUP_009558 [Coryphaenoides rupestris]